MNTLDHAFAKAQKKETAKTDEPVVKEPAKPVRRDAMPKDSEAMLVGTVSIWKTGKEDVCILPGQGVRAWTYGSFTGGFFNHNLKSIVSHVFTAAAVCNPGDDGMAMRALVMEPSCPKPLLSYDDLFNGCESETDSMLSKRYRLDGRARHVMIQQTNRTGMLPLPSREDRKRSPGNSAAIQTVEALTPDIFMSSVGMLALSEDPLQMPAYYVEDDRGDSYMWDLVSKRNVRVSLLPIPVSFLTTDELFNGEPLKRLVDDSWSEHMRVYMQKLGCKEVFFGLPVPDVKQTNLLVCSPQEALDSEFFGLHVVPLIPGDPLRFLGGNAVECVKEVMNGGGSPWRLERQYQKRL